MAGEQTQAERFAKAARDLGCDEDEARWDEAVARVVTPKPEAKQDEAL